MESPSPIEIISIDVPDAVLRKNIQNAASVACVASRHGGLEEAREKFINALVAENGNAKHLTTVKAAYPGLAKQIIATETGESQILDEVGFADDDRMVRKVVRVQPRPCQVEQVSTCVATSSKHEATTKSSANACAGAIDCVKSDEDRIGAMPADDSVDVGLGRDKEDPENKSSVSSSALPVSVDNSGRHECALSDFSVDKEDYRLTRYGLDNTAEDESREQNEDSRLGEERCCMNDSMGNQLVAALPKGENAVRRESMDVVEQDCFPADSVRRSNTQVLVLVSAMIHNPFEKDRATLILDENGVQGKGEITIYKGEPDGSIDKLSLLVQSPKPSSVCEESTVKIQEIVDDVFENAKEGSDDSLALDTTSTKRDVNLEIDGKYVKSVVNSRKSPRKTKGGQMRVYASENEEKQVKDSNKAEKKSTDSCTQSEETFYKTVSKSSSRVSTSRAKSPRKEGKSSRSSGQRTASSSKIHEVGIICEDRTNTAHRYNAAIKGSLDSVIATSDSRTVSRRRSRSGEVFSKKSKSYESIKKIQEVCYEDTSKADSTSQLLTANDLDMQTEEFCSVCCYVNEMSLRTEEGIASPTTDNFYTLRSNCSSIMDEDSTECDICSSWNLQESTDTLDRKIVAATDCDQLCEICEICGELCATFNPDQEATIPATQSSRDSAHDRVLESSAKSIPKDSCRTVDSVATDPTLDDDSFEIENCGILSRPYSVEDRPLGDQAGAKYLSKSLTLSEVPVGKKKSRDKYFIPKDEIAILTSGSRRMSRKGSLLRKKPEDQVNVSQDKRRYSSVDNLQLAKVSGRSSDKVLRSKNSKLIGSADNIRASKSSRRCKSLQRSADNVRYVDSSTDNLDSLVESLGIEDEARVAVDWTGRPNIRDNETVKMILTKHGIKIISEKETAL